LEANLATCALELVASGGYRKRTRPGPSGSFSKPVMSDWKSNQAGVHEIHSAMID
jgi:hypothetical protein